MPLNNNGYANIYIPVKEHFIERMLLQTQQSLTKYDMITMGNIEIMNWCDEISQSFVFQLNAYFAAQPIKEITISYPANWKEAFKEFVFKKYSWIPLQFRLKHRVRYTIKKIKVAAIYKNADLAWPDKSNRCVVQQIDSSERKLIRH
jgi:hypothetical protein